MNRVFIGCPISKFVDMGGDIDPSFLYFIKGIHAVCKEYAGEVFLALDREQYGKAIMPGDMCVPLDYKGMVECDLFIAIPEDSMGVAVEIGWASAHGKELLVFLDQRFSYSPLIKSIHTIARAKVVEYRHENYEASFEVLKGHIEEFLWDRFEKARDGASRLVGEAQ